VERSEAGGKAPDLESLERRLERLDRELLAAARAALGVEACEHLAARAAEDLQRYRELMTEAVYRRTLERQVSRRIREEAGIPELSLFAF
jgi:hypothetical protein